MNSLPLTPNDSVSGAEVPKTEPAPKALHPLFTTDGRKLRLLQTHDRLKQWWTLDELRFCAKCQHVFPGRDIRFMEDKFQVVHFRCPTYDCDGGFEEWQYPRLHL